MEQKKKRPVTSGGEPCPRCQSKIGSFVSQGTLVYRCPVCGWEGPGVDRQGVNSTAEDYET
mgnify:CR=1 FL=1